MFELGIVSTITVLETVITKIQRVQNSFIRLALRLPKYVLAHLLHEASGLPYLTLFDMEGALMPPQMFFTTVPKRLGGGS